MKKIIFLSAAFLCNTLSADIYVNNLNGFDGNSGKSQDKAVKTLRAGVKKMHLHKDSKLVLANTEVPYYESLRLMNFSGTPQKPIVVEGGGAVISGLRELPVDKWEKNKDGIWYYQQKRYGALRPYLVINGKRVTEKNLTKLEPFSHYWSRKGVFFKPGKGKSINDYKIFATILTSGFTVNNSSYITCRNLTCEYFSNDGFNIHGNSQGLIFENITGRRNGDDGFSIHEDVGVTVRGGHFHENNYGIQDVNASRSEYYGVTVNDNRRIGINLMGGTHAIVDASVKNNKWTQIQLESNRPKHMHFSKDAPIFKGAFYLKNVFISGGGTGLQVKHEAAVTVSNCFISGSKTGVFYKGTGLFHIYKSIITKCSKAEINASGRNFHFDLNCYYPGQMILNGKKYSPKDFKQWQADSNGDNLSVVKKAKDTFYFKKDSKSKRHIKIGSTYCPR